MRPSVNIRQFSVRSETFHYFRLLSVQQGDLRPLPSTLRATRRCSVNLRQCFVQPEDLSSTSVNFPCCQKIFYYLFVRPGDLPSTSVIFLCHQETFHQLLSSFSVARRPSVNFHHLCVQPLYFPSNSVNPPCHQDTFSQPQLTFRAARRPSVNFPCNQENFRQIFVPPGDPP